MIQTLQELSMEQNIQNILKCTTTYKRNDY